MHPYAPPPRRTALCPARSQPPALGPAQHRPAHLQPHRGLVLSLTLPGDPRSASVGRHAVTAALPSYGFRSHAWPVTHAVTELISVNAALTPGRDLYLSLRQRDGALRLVLWDQHPHHADPGTLVLCELRRRRALWLLAAVVDDWGGEWGLAGAQPPHTGVRSWAVLPQ
ncbi:ATP-binding protein [Streptomyces sp. NBC_01213]|uniref:ATP-binding protein n=1 Tax=Streptomyces sp. NBC_01213 TaxID=2903776 RepID=UPI00352E5D50|nr:ATP-binding protein [Streptomyces sp. NBC_01213]